MSEGSKRYTDKKMLRVKRFRSDSGTLKQNGQSGWALILEKVTSELRHRECVGGGS